MFACSFVCSFVLSLGALAWLVVVLLWSINLCVAQSRSAPLRSGLVRGQRSEVSQPAASQPASRSQGRSVPKWPVSCVRNVLVLYGVLYGGVRCWWCVLVLVLCCLLHGLTSCDRSIMPGQSKSVVPGQLRYPSSRSSRSSRGKGRSSSGSCSNSSRSRSSRSSRSSCCRDSWRVLVSGRPVKPS